MKDAVLPRPSRRRVEADHPPYDVTAVAAVLERWAGTPGNLLPVLHDVQAALGHVPPGCVAQIARALNRSRAEVHGVISFYHDFRRQPAGRHVLKVCQAESCQATGGRALTARLEQLLGCGLGETSADGAVTLEAVYCLGNCACSPAMMLDGRLFGRVTEAAAERLLAEARQDA
ncbi:MAG: formate dehydrogenase subunit gamma [Betaproteobacteria bacterium]|jgi:formate dehydrogenase subunit gamma|nr:formate dehydrogenase subunit gamma [Rhodocyclaceae bacterium]MCA3135457.1 formate dehydrogenase subunit gamma [Rhodocyclaceae bacterium]MCA3143728.1 formate dehydrogenase subunit gamma [Rhodocyclaceae bacterium]MCA3144496.1 formate dehydrogenase subunit gamma [Rhodocyclaceae bacterium]MCE2897580.1 formate dehydrogenase subunit gamma [Betaproteobacteria bacterium]